LAINSRTRAALSEGRGNLEALKNPVLYERRPNSVKPPNTMVPNGSKFVFGELEVLEKYGSSGRTRTYNPPVNSRMLCH
jgi:hypothetical protein